MSHLAALTASARFAGICLGLASAFTARAASAQEDAPLVAPSAAEDEASDLEKARQHFLRGVQFYNNGDFKISLVEFRRSYDLSNNYRVLYNIGQVNQQLGNYTQALAALERYLAEGGTELQDERRAEVSASVASLQKRVAHLRIIANVPGTEVLVDGFPAVASGPNAMITVDPGDHRVDTRKAGYQAAGTVVTVAAGDVTEVRLKLNKIPTVVLSPKSALATPAPRDTTWMWIGWTTTGAAALGAGITGVLASMHASDLAELRNSPTSTQAQRDDVGNRGRTFAIASDVLTATAVAAGAASLYITLRPPRSEAGPRPAPALRVALSPGAVAVQQSF